MEWATRKTALEEFVKLLLENEGELELDRAVLLLSHHNRKLVSDYGALEFVKRYPIFRVNQTRQRKSKVIVKLDVPLKFCPQAGETGGCTDRRCDRLHLCPFFVKGSCKFGDKCKRSHDFRDEHTIRALEQFRLDFLSSYLLQKILKIIVDEGEIQRTAANRSVPDICKFYNKAVCKKGELCPCLHVCEHFVDGDCKFGESCKRKHDFSDEHNRTVLEEYHMGGNSNSRVLRCLKRRERKRTFSASTNEDATPLRRNLVQSPLSNTGGNFPMSPPSMKKSRSTHSLPEICKFYNKATCKKGEQCHCLHVCEHFVNGDCKFGEKCKRDHDFSNSHNRRILKQNDMGDISELRVLERLQTRERKRTVSTSSDGDRPEQLMSLSANAISVPSVQVNNTDKDTEICGFNLCGKCNYGNSCIHRHTELPYLWEFAAQSDDRWESFSSDLNMTLERAYCDVRNDFSETVTIKGSLYHVCFQDMTAVPLFPHAAISALNTEVPRVRRLSTISSVLAAAGHVFSTRWLWYWKDENDKWQSYDTPGDRHAVNTTSSQCFERDYVAGKDTHSFSAGHHQYTLHFKEWCQQNDALKTKRPVRRRPTEFVSKEKMKDIIVQRRRAGVMAHPTSLASTESEELPSYWMPIPEGEDYSCVVLQTISDEYKKTEKTFQKTMDGSHKIIRIERVQNPDLWTQYTQRKSRMAKKSGKEPEERQLFHGTSPDTAKAICQQGFDWRMCGKHGTVYGKGSYFACKANYSHGYSNQGVSLRGYKQMFLARVVVH